MRGLGYQYRGLLVGFHSADLEHALQYWVSCTAFGMGMLILILIASSRAPTKACSLSDLCLLISHFRPVRGFEKKNLLCLHTVLFLPPRLFTLSFGDQFHKMNFSCCCFMQVFLYHSWKCSGRLEMHWQLFHDVSHNSQVGISKSKEVVWILTLIAKDISVNLIKENPAFPHTSLNVLSLHVG